MQRFLSGNGHPHQLIDARTNLEAEVLLQALEIESDQMPVVFLSDGTVLRKPANQCWPTSWASMTNSSRGGLRHRGGGRGPGRTCRGRLWRV